MDFLVAAYRLTGVSVGSVSENHSLSLLPYTELDGALEVLSLLEAGGRLERPAGCPDWADSLMQRCWKLDEYHRRIRDLRRALQDAQNEKDDLRAEAMRVPELRERVAASERRAAQAERMARTQEDAAQDRVRIARDLDAKDRDPSQKITFAECVDRDAFLRQHATLLKMLASALKEKRLTQAIDAVRRALPIPVDDVY